MNKCKSNANEGREKKSMKEESKLIKKKDEKTREMVRESFETLLTDQRVISFSFITLSRGHLYCICVRGVQGERESATRRENERKRRGEDA